MPVILNIDFLLFSAEIFFFCSLLIYLLFCIFFKENINIMYISNFIFILIIFYIFLLMLNFDIFTFQTSFNLFHSNLFIYYFKLFFLFIIFFFFFLISSYFSFESLKSFEFFIILGYAILGLFLLISSFDFLSLYLCIELQSLSFYILASYKYFSNFSAEAGIKYFVLGAVSSCILLLGISFLYGLTGTTNFADFYFINYWLFFSNLDISLFLQTSIFLSFLLIIISFFFKIGAAPFHLWVPDVYEGSPSIVTAFFAIVPKFIIFGVLIKFINIFFLFNFFYIFFIYIGILSVFIGSFGALYQIRLKRLIAYSSITHVGFILLGLSSFNLNGIFSVLFYLFFYSLINLNLFSIILSIRKNNFILFKNIYNLSTLIKNNIFLGYCFAFALFSIAGIPPLLGFYSKFFIFFSLINSSFFFLTFILIILSIISAFYYIRLIKILFFDLSDNFVFLLNMPKINSFLISFLTLFNFIFCFFPDFIFYPINVMIFNFLFL